MKTLLRFVILVGLFIPTRGFAQTNSANGHNSINCNHVSFEADVTEGCSPLAVNFKDKTDRPADDPIVKWKWTFGDGTTSTEKNPFHIFYNATGRYSVKLVVKAKSGWCDSVVKENLIASTGVPKPSLGNDTTICAGTTIELHAGFYGDSFLWSTGEKGFSIKVNKAGQYWVKVKKDGCIGRDTINIETRENCEVWFEPSVKGGCSPVSVQFTAMAEETPNDPIVEWHWEFEDGTQSFEKNPLHIFYNATGKYGVKLTVRAQSGWTASAYRPELIASVGVPKPDLGRDTLLCEGSAIQLHAGFYGDSFLWNTGATGWSIVCNQPGQYWVTVTKDGCVGSDTINVGDHPPLWPDFSQQQSGTCLPKIVQFTDLSTNCNGDRAVRWEWDFGDGSTSTEQNPVHNFWGVDSFNVRLTVWDENGFSITRSKRVVIEPTQSFQVNLGNDTSICEMQSLYLDAGYLEGATYTWSTGDIMQTTVITNSGTVWVRVDYNGCIGTDTIEVEVKPAVIPSFVFSQQGNCVPLPVAFIDNSSTCEVNILSWTWDFGDGGFAFEQHPEHIYMQNGEYTVTLTVTDDWGNTFTRSKMITVNGDNPSVNLGQDTTIIFGDVLMLDAGNAGGNFSWSTGETTQEIYVIDDGDYWVQVIVGECSSFDTIHVTTMMPVMPTFYYTVDGTCLPIKVKFKDGSSANGNNNIVQWRWDFGDGTTSTEQNPEHIYTRADSFGVKLTVITNTGYSISRARKVNVINETPKLDLGKDITICQGETIKLRSSIDGNSYKWTPAQTLSNANVADPVAKPDQTTTYALTVEKCMVTLTDDIKVIVSQPERPYITQDGNNLTASDANTWQWFKNGKKVDYANRKNFTPDRVGHYSIQVTNKNGCVYESDKYFFMPDLTKIKALKGIKVTCSPNPSPGIVYLYLSKMPNKYQNIQATVLDRFGKPLFTTTIRNNTHVFHLTTVAKGQYFIELRMGDEKITLPILIQ